MNITEKEFMDIALQHQISPWEYDDPKVKTEKNYMIKMIGMTHQ